VSFDNEVKVMQYITSVAFVILYLVKKYKLYEYFCLVTVCIFQRYCYISWRFLLLEVLFTV